MTTRTSRMQYADRLFRFRIRERDRDCQASGFWGVGCAGPLEVAHFHARRHRSVRWVPENAALLCREHHRWADGHEDDKWLFISMRLGEKGLRTLRARRNELWDKDYDRLIESLRAQP